MPRNHPRCRRGVRAQCGRPALSSLRAAAPGSSPPGCHGAMIAISRTENTLRGCGFPARLACGALAVLTAAGVLAIPPAGAQRERVVNVYNWSDYVDPSVLDAFTREAGIKVRYDTFDSNDTLETKLLAGKSGYDVVVPSAYFLQRQIKAGVFGKLDKSKLPHLGATWPAIDKHLAAYDPGNQYAVNYMWGTVGIGYNVEKMHEILGATGVIDSWNTVFVPAELAKFKD